MGSRPPISDDAYEDVGSGGPAERFIFVCVGLVMLALGVVGAWLTHRFIQYPYADEFRHIKVAAAASASFFLLRASWFALKPRKTRTRFKLTSASR